MIYHTISYQIITKATDAHSELWNTYCFSTTTMVIPTCLSATLYVHCLSC